MTISGNLLSALNAGATGAVAVQITGVDSSGTSKTWYLTTAPAVSDGTRDYFSRIKPPVPYFESIGLTTDFGGESIPNSLELTIDNRDGTLDEMVDYDFGDQPAVAYQGVESYADGSAFAWADWQKFLDGVIDPANSALGGDLNTLRFRLLSAKAEGYNRMVVKELYTGDGIGINVNNGGATLASPGFNPATANRYTARFIGTLNAAPAAGEFLFGGAGGLKIIVVASTAAIRVQNDGATSDNFTYTLPVGQRVDLVFRWGGANISLYVDGTLREQIASATAVTAWSAGCTIGTAGLDMDISEAAFADTDFGAVKVIGLMARGPGQVGATDGWDALWKCEEGSGTTVADWSGNGEDLTFTADSWLVTNGGDDPTLGASGTRGGSELLAFGGFSSATKKVAVRNVPAVLLSELDGIWSLGAKPSSISESLAINNLLEVRVGEEPLRLPFSWTESFQTVAASTFPGSQSQIIASTLAIDQAEDARRLVEKTRERRGSKIQFTAGPNAGVELEVIHILENGTAIEVAELLTADGPTSRTLTTVLDDVSGVSLLTDPRTMTLDVSPGGDAVTFSLYDELGTSGLAPMLGHVIALALRNPDERPEDINGSSDLTNYENGFGTGGPALGVVFPQAGDRPLRSVVRDLLNSEFAYLRDDGGTQYIGLINDTTGAPTWSLTDSGDGTVIRSMRLIKRLLPIWQIALLHNQTNAQQPKIAVTSTDISVEAEASAAVGEFAIVSDTEVRDNNPNARSVIWPTAIVETNESPQVSARLQAFFGSGRRCWEVASDTVGRSQRPGSALTITRDRYGFDSGVSTFVAAIRWKNLAGPGARGATITVWD